MEKLRVALTSAPENAYFDSTKITEVYTDASPVGVAAILTQKEPDMSLPEQNYSQLEREALAIFTDHQPLVKIFTNPAPKPSARFERWSLRL